MPFFILAGDKHAVTVGTSELETAQDTINEALEGVGGVPLPEGHSDHFERAKWEFVGLLRA